MALAVAPEARSPRLHVTGPEPVHEADFDMTVTGDPKVSATFTPTALDGPGLVAVMVTVVD